MSEKNNKNKKTNLLRRLWQFWWRPSRLAFGVLVMGGFILGVTFLAGTHYGMQAVSSEAFCISCHEMRDHVYEEYLDSPHFSNRSGVRATCSDCHIPHDFLPMMVRKIAASKEVFYHFTGKIDTPTKFEQHRKEMAMREWARMKANDSAECRSCHQFSDMDLSQQTEVAAQMHRLGEERGQTCIDCHKGIVHKLPDMTGIEPGF